MLGPSRASSKPQLHAGNLGQTTCPMQTLRGQQQALEMLRNKQPKAPPLAHDLTFLYTDGSHVRNPDSQGPGIGAAVYIPCANPETATTLAIYCTWAKEPTPDATLSAGQS